jgi:ATP-binding cassette subfamily B protein
MTARMDRLVWPAARAAEALEALARAAALPVGAATSAVGPGTLVEGLSGEAAAQQLGLELEPIASRYPDLLAALASAAPALITLPGPPRLLAVTASGRRRLTVLGPDLVRHRVATAAVAAALVVEQEQKVAPLVDSLLGAAGVPARRRPRARAALFAQQLSKTPVEGVSEVRVPAAAGLRPQMSALRLWRWLALFGCAHALAFLLGLFAWATIGRASLEGRLDRAWIFGWALLLLTIVPFRLLASWAQGICAIGVGGFLKRRLLEGALRLDPDEIRRDGTGALLGRVLESEAVESLALSGGLFALGAGFELFCVLPILAVVPGGWPILAALGGFGALVAVAGRSYLDARKRWTQSRLELTGDLCERMVGHRTRLAQEAQSERHLGEDRALGRYLELSEELDRHATRLDLLPRLWLLVGLCALGPGFVAGSAGALDLAVGLGGVLLAQRAIARLSAGLAHLAGSQVAWQSVRLLYQAAGRPELLGAAGPVLAPGEGAIPGCVLVEAEEVVYRYPGRSEPVLRGPTLRVRMGDRLLLRGPSGAGKSTLTQILVGLRAPQSGVVLLGGLDRGTVGQARWHQQIVAAPQFHENHVFGASFAFNLLMGRSWPPAPADLHEARALCDELGLGDLVARMPGGLFQMVGETGWQLSHGERSRLFIARALLQRASLIILDESFAALDPETLRRTMRCVLARAPTTLVVAHP